MNITGYPVSKTAPVSGGNYTDFGGYRLPTFTADQLQWNAPSLQAGGGGDGDVQNHWMNPSTLSFLGQYDPSISNYSNGSNWALAPMYEMKNGDYGAYQDTATKDFFTGMLKTGDKEGTIFKYGLQDGQYIPLEELGKQKWDSNFRGASLAAIAAATIATMGAASAGYLGAGAQGAMGGASGAAGGGAAGTGGWAGMGLVDASAAGLPASSGGWWGAAEGLGSLGGGSSLGNLAGFDAPWPTGMTEGLGGGGAGLGNLGGFDAPWPSGISPGTSPSSTSWLDILKKGSGALSSLTGNSGSSGGNSGLLDLLSAAYSANRNRDFADKLMEPYNYYRDQQNPFIDMLKKSYTEPDSFYGSNQYQGLKDVYQNQIDRTAAKQGRLSNPTDREVLLQKHAMSAMEDYRKGLATSVGATSPMQALQMYGTGAGYDSFSNTPFFGAAGYNGGTKSVTDILGSLGKLGSTATDVWDKISGWFK